MNFRLWLENEEENAELYFSIGHGDYDDDYGAEPDYIVWTLINGEIKTSKRIKSNRDSPTTHGSEWGHDTTDYTYKGRYEPQTGRLSIVKPDRFKHYGIHPDVMSLLRRKFKKITKVYEF